METFLQRLKVVNEDLTCAVCSELCEDPVTFDKCFHSACGAHVPLTELFLCPVCGASNRNAKNVRDYSFEKAVVVLKGLNDIFCNGVFAANKSVDKADQTSSINNKGSVREGKRPYTEFNKLQCLPTTPVDKISTKSQYQSAISTLTQRSNKTVENTINNHKLYNESVATDHVSMKSRKNLEKRNRKGETPLHVACVSRKHDKVVELLQLGANPNTKDNAGWTPLHEVVENGAIEIVKVLLEHGALSDVPGCHNETPLHEAVRYNFVDIAVLLIEHGADVHTRNSKGETPLDLVGNDDAFKELLVNSEIKTQTANILQVSALFIEQELEDMHILPVSISSAGQKKLESLGKKHQNLKVEIRFNKKITHIITDVEDNRTCYSTVEILQAIVHGKWILSSDWLDDTLQSDRFSNFEEYEVGGIEMPSSDGPRRARFNKYRQLPGLFDGCHFYLYAFSTKCEISKRLTFTKQALSKLITDAGGKLLRREPNPELILENETTIPYHASKSGSLAKCSHYIIYHESAYAPMYNMEHLKVLPIGWLIECIEKFELCDNYSFL